MRRAIRVAILSGVCFALSGCSCWLENISHVPPNPETDVPVSLVSCEELHRRRENALWTLEHRIGSGAEDALDDLNAIVAKLKARCWYGIEHNPVGV